jgi:hypothetical protein
MILQKQLSPSIRKHQSMNALDIVLQGYEAASGALPELLPINAVIGFIDGRRKAITEPRS